MTIPPPVASRPRSPSRTSGARLPCGGEGEDQAVRPGDYLRLTCPALLRALMDRWAYSLADVAVIAGTHRSAISHLVAGRAHALRAGSARRIARALRVELDTLFVAKGTPVPDGVTWGAHRARPPEVARILDHHRADTDTR